MESKRETEMPNSGKIFFENEEVYSIGGRNTVNSGRLEDEQEHAGSRLGAGVNRCETEITPAKR
jgi:hypothetical protein